MKLRQKLWDWICRKRRFTCWTCGRRFRLSRRIKCIVCPCGAHYRYIQFTHTVALEAGYVISWEGREIWG